MKSLLTSVVLIISLSANSQITSFIKHGDTVYCYFPLTKDSIRVNYAAASGSASWGGIQGTISNQTDLQSLINSYLTVANAAATYQPIGSYLTANQTISFAPTGDVTGSTTGATSLTPSLSIGAGKVTNAMLAGSIDLTTKVTGVLPFANGGIGTSAATSATTGTMTVNMTTEMVTITPSGTCTFNASGGVAGQRVTFIITTSGTSSFTLTFGTNFKAAGALATGTTTAKVFTVSFVYNGSTWMETGRTTAM